MLAVTIGSTNLVVAAASGPHRLRRLRRQRLLRFRRLRSQRDSSHRRRRPPLPTSVRWATSAAKWRRRWLLHS